MTTWADLDGTRWEGAAELWEDPLGDEVQRSDCSLSIAGDVLGYAWSHQGKPHEGRIVLSALGGEYRDSWHQQEAVTCSRIDNPRSLATLAYTYMETWGWRINVCFREPTGELVVQMTNIAPWGEEARAVRMVGRRLETASSPGP